MKTLTINGKSYSGIQGTMSDKQFESMLLRNDMTTDKMNKLFGKVRVA